jgi:rubrerythrin
MSGGSTRRHALRTAALGAGALAGAGLLRPVAALAQSTSDDDLRDFLAPAIALEQIGVFAYDAALDAPGVTDAQKRIFTRFRDQEQAHANAWRKALDNLGFDLPEAPDATDDTGAFDVEGISDDQRKKLAATLAKIDDLKKVDDFLDYLVDVEDQEIAYYSVNAPSVDSVDLANVSAQVAANQAQHLVVLDTERKQKPAQILGSISSASAEVGSSL